MTINKARFDRVETKQLFVDKVEVTATPDELNILDGATVTVDEINSLDGKIQGATIVVGTEDEPTDTINVTIQLVDGNGDDLEEVGYVTAFLSDAATGIGLTASAPVSDVTIGTDGAFLAELVADSMWIVQSEADGDIDIDVAHDTSAGTWYLVVVLPDGSHVVSGAITFAAD